jgi:hypothetical protein
MLVAMVKGTDARATFVLEPPQVATPGKTVAPTKKENVKRASR